jgi:hypothetical protein
MRFTKKHMRDIASLIPWRETTILGQVPTARRLYCASKEEALCVLLARRAMPSRVEDLIEIARPWSKVNPGAQRECQWCHLVASSPLHRVDGMGSSPQVVLMVGVFP